MSTESTETPAPKSWTGPPPIDPECKAALDRLPPFAELTLETIPQLREPHPMFPPPSNDELSRAGAFVVTELTAPASDPSIEMSILVSRPTNASDNAPCLYFIHGGGMVSGSPRHGLSPILDIAGELGSVVVAVDYRLAPEAPHPTPVEDCYAGLRWTLANANVLGISPERVILVGSSAGGGLAAAVSLIARDRGEPSLLGQVLMAPMLDDRNNSLSVLQMEGTDTWNRSANLVGWTALLGDTCGSTEVSPYASPARATDLSGLPPTFLDVGSAETFRDEVVAFANNLWRHGADAELHVWAGGVHGYDMLVPESSIGSGARRARLEWLRRLLTRHGGRPTS